MPRLSPVCLVRVSRPRLLPITYTTPVEPTNVASQDQMPDESRKERKSYFENTHKPTTILRFMPSFRKAVQSSGNKLLRDKWIKNDIVNFVDLEDNHHPRTRKDSIKYDSSLYTLLNLTPGAHIPTCKLISKDRLREIIKKKEEEKKQLRQNLNNCVKEIFLTWTISEHDAVRKVELAYRHMEKGGIVEVHFQNKRRKNSTDAAYRQKLVTKIGHLLGKYGTEWRSQVGTVQGKVILYYKGNDTAPDKNCKVE